MPRSHTPPAAEPPSAASKRTRFDAPIAKAKELTSLTLAWFPVRVWRHFLQHNGFVLAAGVSYQALFTIFAALYLAFAIVGILFGGNDAAIDRLVEIVNGYVPGIIGESGLVSRDQVAAIADATTSTLSITGGIAFVVLIWTAIGFVTYARRAVRDIVALPPDTRGYVRLKVRDLAAAAIFGGALLLGGIFGSAATWALDVVLEGLGLVHDGFWLNTTARGLSLIFSLAINITAIAGLARFLIGITVPWRVIFPGSILGGTAMTVVQIGAGFLLSATPRNPLLATFAVFVGMLLWFRINGIIILVATAWIAVAAQDRDLALRPLTDLERRETEHAALRIAATVRVREAELELAAASWWRRRSARRRLRDAHDELARIEATWVAPPKFDASF